MLLEILGTIGGTGAALAIVTYLSQKLVLHRLSKDLEAYRSRLEAERDHQIEQLKHGFEIAALEHQVTFQQVYGKRRDALRDMHISLRESLELCLQVASSTGDSKLPQANSSLSGLTKKILEVEIYLTRDQCERWLSTVSNMATAISNLRTAREARTSNWEVDRQDLLKAVDEHAKVWRELNVQLVDEIREIIGIKGKSPNQALEPTIPGVTPRAEPSHESRHLGSWLILNVRQKISYEN